MDADAFAYDVFLSHSSKDEAVVRSLAERLRKDGLRVWFSDWEILPGDSIPSKIDAGLEASRLLVLCMSTHALGSDWAALESQTFRFRDPLNKGRRFIPLRLDDSEPKGTLAQFLSVDWREAHRSAQYPKLLEACRPAESARASREEQAQKRQWERIVPLEHTAPISSVALSQDGRLALSGSADNTVRLWEVESGRCLRVLEGHTSRVWSVAFSRNGKFVLSGSEDKTLRLWETASGRCLQQLRGHTLSVRSVAFSPDSRMALSGSADGTVRMWEASTGRCLRVLEGHTQRVCSVAWSPRGPLALSGSDDKTVRLWNAVSGVCLGVLEGHTQGVRSVAWSPDAQMAVSGSDDRTVRYWKIKSGPRQAAADAVTAEPGLVLKGHTGPVLGVAFSRTGRFVLSCSDDWTIRFWDYGLCIGVLDEHTGSVGSIACGPEDRLALSGSADHSCRLWNIDTRRPARSLNDSTGIVTSASWSPDGRQALTGSSDRTMRLWSARSGQRLRVFEGHTGAVLSVAWRPLGGFALSGSDDCTVRVWDIEQGKCLRPLEGHTSDVLSVAWSPDGWLALSGSSDRTLRIWEVNTGQCIRVLEGHFDSILSVAWSPDGRFAASGSGDKAVRLWDVDTGECRHILEGHTHRVQSVAWSPDGRYVVSGASDNTLRIWEAATGRCLRVLEGHTNEVWTVAWSRDGRLVLSGGCDGTLRLWEGDTGRCLCVLDGHSDRIQTAAFASDGQSAFSAAVNGVMRWWNLEDEASAAVDAAPALAPTEEQYTNAKVLLVGESGAGKTGLATRLAHDQWKESSSTVGAWATQWKLPVAAGEGVEQEIWLWDFGGQADQRLIHQLYMDETALAVLVFDPQKEDMFDTLGQWDRDVSRAARGPLQKLLVAGRVDAGGLRASRATIDAFVRERDYLRYLETSARTGSGCKELREAILKGIRWEEIPWRSSPKLFKRLKEEIIRLKDAGRVLMRRNELLETLRLKLASTGERFTDDQLKAVVSLLTGPGVVWEFAFGSWVLLQPERINAYAQAVIRTLRDDEHQLGCVLEERVLQGDLAYAASMPRLPPDEERIVLLAMHQTLVERGLCLRIRDPNGKTPSLLVFPSYYGRERPDLVGHPAVFVSFRFNGFLEDIYATLVVRLHYSQYEQAELWRYAADFRTALGRRLGIKLTRRAEGAGELEVYFEPSVSVEDKVVFSRYVHEHLLQKAKDVERLRHYVCPHCGTSVANRLVAMKRLAEGKENIICVSCEDRVPLWDELEQRLASPETRKRVRELQERARVVLVHESQVRALVGEVISTVALAGQRIRELPLSRHGISMEVELQTDRGERTGQKLLLMLGSSSVDTFEIQQEEDAAHWMAQEFPVLLVVRLPDGEIRWMDIRDWLRRETDGGQKPVKQLPVEGERFDVMAVRRWRDRVLGSGITPAA